MMISRYSRVFVGLVAATAMVFSVLPAETVQAAPQGTLVGWCTGNAIYVEWGSHADANSNGLQKGDSHPSDSDRFWDWLPTGDAQRSYTDSDIVPGTTYWYRVKYRPELPSNVISVSCPARPTPTPFPTPSPFIWCSADRGTVSSGERVTFSVYASYPYRDVNYAWTAVGGYPSSGTGPSFRTRFHTSSIEETRVVSVTDGFRSAECSVRVIGPRPTPSPEPTLRCAVDDDSVSSGELVTFSARGGEGRYYWLAHSGYPTSGWGSEFSTRFTNYSGSDVWHSVTLYSGSQSRDCSVRVRPERYPTPTPYPSPYPTPVPVLSCSPAYSSVQSGQTVYLYAYGGNGAYYSWSAPEGSPASGWGRDFATKFFNYSSYVRSYFVTVRSQGSGYDMVNSCEVRVAPYANATPTPYPTPHPTPHPTPYPTVTPVPSSDLTMTQAAQNVSIGQSAWFPNVRAKANETVRFSLTVRNAAPRTLTNAWITDLLPAGLSYVRGSTTVNGEVVSDGITASGLNLGALAPGQQVVIRLAAVVDGAYVPDSGILTVYNTAQARADGAGVAITQLPVHLTNRSVIGAAGGTNTGVGTVAASLVAALAAALLYLGYTRSPHFGRRYSLARVKTIMGDKDRMNFARFL